MFCVSKGISRNSIKIVRFQSFPMGIIANHTLGVEFFRARELSKLVESQNTFVFLVFWRVENFRFFSRKLFSWFRSGHRVWKFSKVFEPYAWARSNVELLGRMASLRMVGITSPTPLSHPLERGARPRPSEGRGFTGSTVLPAGYQGEHIIKKQAVEESK